jgi:hypothetical protein
MKYLILATILLPIAFSGTLALAQGSGMMGGGMMGGGMMGGGMMGGGMMGRGMMNDGRGRMMGQRMEGCMQMMQGMHGGSQRPNEQWRQR